MTTMTTAAGDREASYSADRIAYGKPVRTPFRHGGDLWVCTGIWGSALTESGATEHEAYRIVPQGAFTGATATYAERTGSAEAAAAARADPNGFYHGMVVQHGRGAFVLCGPPARFAADGDGEPAQMALF